MDQALFKKIRQALLVKGGVMRIRKLLFVSITLFIMFISCLPVYCQNNDDVVSGKTIDGSVVSVDSQRSQIVVKSSETITFFVPSGAKIINDDGFDIQLSDVSVGNYVSVDYRDDSSGNHVADVIEVQYNR